MSRLYHTTCTAHDIACNSRLVLQRLQHCMLAQATADMPCNLVAGTARSLTASRSGASAQEAAAQFAEDFVHQYGELHPTWEATSWQTAAARAHQRFCFLFVYLHSPSHPVSLRGPACFIHSLPYWRPPTLLGSKSLPNTHRAPCNWACACVDHLSSVYGHSGLDRVNGLSCSRCSWITLCLPCGAGMPVCWM